MRVLLTGATGAIGPAIIDVLLERGHQVVAMVRDEEKAHRMFRQRVDLVKADVLDRLAVADAVAAAQPHAIIHQATALARNIPMTQFARLFKETNLIRTAGTDNLLAAAGLHGIGKIVAQSFCGWPYAQHENPVVSEDHPFDPQPAKQLRESSAALQHLEAAVIGNSPGGVALRYGGLYGPGTAFSGAGGTIGLIRDRKFPLIGKGTGWWSFIHTTDAATATVAALEPSIGGIYNIVDDDPAAVSDWLPTLAAQLGAKPPLHVPVWLGRLVAGDHLVDLLNNVCAGSNKKAKADLAWSLRYPSWRNGFAEAFGGQGTGYVV